MRRYLQPSTVLIIVIFFWSSTFAVTKDLVEHWHWPAVTYLMWRFIIGGLVLYTWYRWIYKGPPLWKGSFKPALIIATLLNLGISLQVIGQIYTTTTKTAFITGFFVPLTPLLGWIFFRDKPQLKYIVSLLIGVCGFFLLIYPNQGLGQEHFNKGDLLVFISAFFYALGVNYTSYKAKHIDAMQLTTAQILLSAVMLIFFALVGLVIKPFWPSFLHNHTLLPPLTKTATWELLYMGVICTAIVFPMQNWCLQRIKPIRSALLFALEPIFATALAMLAFGHAQEWPGLRGAIGATVTLFAALLPQFPLERIFTKRSQNV